MTSAAGARDRGLKVLLSHRYFWPDTPPYASMLRTIAEGLAAEGHDVTVFSSQPSYRTSRAARRPRVEHLGGVRVLRIPVLPERGRPVAVRVLNNAWYVTALFSHVMARSYDVVVAASFPPIVAGRATSVAARLRRTPFVYHCQDLHPEVGRIEGMLADGILFRLLRRVDEHTCDAAARVVVLSEDMRATLAARPDMDASRVVVINNFLPETFEDGVRTPAGLEDPDADAALPGSTGDRGEESHAAPVLPGVGFHVVFAGNLGRFQGLEAVVDAARLLAEQEDVHFVFLGGGVMEGELRRRAGPLLGRTVHFLSHKPQSVAQELVRAADLALVPLRQGVYRVAYPSKTLTCLAMGVPVLAAVEPESELARMVEAERVGWVASPEDPDGLAAAVTKALRERDALPRARDRARELYERRFSVGHSLRAWAGLVKEVAR